MLTISYKTKQEARGYPSWCQSDSEKEKFIRDYEDAEGVRLDPSSIKKNPGRRAFAKIMLSCLRGKLAQLEKKCHKRNTLVSRLNILI